MAEEVTVPSYQDVLKQSLTEELKPQAQPAQAVATEEIQNTPDANQAPTFDPVSYLKENFGEEYADPEKIKSKLTAPAPEPVYKDPEFTNEESKLIYQNLQAGNHKIVKDYLDKKDLAASLPEKSAADIIKLGWKQEFGLTDAQVERRFSKTYSIAEAELMEDEDKEIEQKLIDKQIEKEADKYKDFFSKYNTEITLPSLDKPVQASTQPEPSAEALKAERYAAELAKGLPTEVSKIGYAFADDKSDYKLSGQIELTEDEIAKVTAPLTGYEDKYLASRWFNQNGTPNDKLIQRDIFVLNNLPEIINRVAADVVHQTRIEEQKRNRNYQAPGQIVQGDFIKSEDELKKEHYRKYYM